MISSKVELLAPAGDFSCFMAAVNAGADAVYLGGPKFGARAYANNFTETEIIEALKIAHLFNKKIYLTVNTLVKNRELDELIPYIAPLYKAGLYGVIVQDMGVLEIMQRHFPDMAIHASTQMTITGIYGAKLLKNMGVCRIVPARELSLDEIKDIKDSTGLEIEAFIHGAMCYSYSGQCLLSSMLGGRSGNRGRCAGPCRLPYTGENGKTVYPLSLKDMYTLPIIPELINAGVTSFKIEGRMKSAEYVAGVTSVYRKYINKYLANPKCEYIIDAKDEELLRGLYIRSGICGGYYKQHNSKDMVTINEAGYSGSSKETLDSIRSQYLNKKPSLDIEGSVYVHAGEPIKYALSYNGICVSDYGGTASAAQSRPLSAEELKERFSKLGDTYFNMKTIAVDTDGNSFAPIKALNELRRSVCGKLESAITAQNSARHVTYDNKIPERTGGINNKNTASDNTNLLAASVTTAEQLKIVCGFSKIKRLYADADLLCRDASLQKYTAVLKENSDIQIYAALPYILRKRSYKYLPEYRQLLEGDCIEGALVRNLDELQWLIDIDYKGQIILDHTIYTWNNEAYNTYKRFFDRITAPLELNQGELSRLGHGGHSDYSAHSDMEMLIYGYLPLMYSANCVRTTIDKCVKSDREGQNIYRLADRYKNVFPVAQKCRHCYNILYNTVPLSLFGQLDSITQMGFNALRLDFTMENADETKQILECYINGKEFPIKNFTNGHYKRGAE